MKLAIFNKLKNVNVEINIIILIILFYLLRGVVPVFKYPFVIISSVFLIYTIITTFIVLK